MLREILNKSGKEEIDYWQLNNVLLYAKMVGDFNRPRTPRITLLEDESSGTKRK